MLVNASEGAGDRKGDQKLVTSDLLRF